MNPNEFAKDDMRYLRLLSEKFPNSDRFAPKSSTSVPSSVSPKAQNILSVTSTVPIPPLRI